MGQENGKNLQGGGDNYIEQQLEVFRWRADPASNVHIARVSFASKHALLNRQRLQMLLAQQLHSHAYVDVRDIVQLSRSTPTGAHDQVMTFEDYVGDLTAAQARLTLEQTLYVLEVLLRGYETVLQKLGEVHIALDCCFLTDQGEVRAWINPNHMSNECAGGSRRENKLQGGLQTSEVGAVKEIIRLSEQLPSNPTAYLHFAKHLRSFLHRDLLHHLNFASVRKFINGYLYAHRLVLPLALPRLAPDAPPPANTTHLHVNSSLAELIEDREFISKAKLASTGANLQTYTRKNEQLSENDQSEDGSVSGMETESRPHFEYYRPAAKKLHEKKMSTAELRLQEKSGARQLSRSEMVSKKELPDCPSLSNSFSRKEQPHYEQSLPQPNFSFTPHKHLCDSTALYSQFTHSKQQSRLSSHAEHSCSTLHPAEPPRGRLERKTNHSKYVDFCQQDAREQKENWKQQAHKTHNKQPSFDESSAAVFVNPTCLTPKHCLSRGSFPARQLQLRESQIVVEEGESGRVSTTMEKSQSQHLSRQVSGLVSNCNLSLHESQGSFSSGCQSDYQGTLAKMGRSAKLVHVPSTKGAKGNTEPKLKA